MNSEKKSQLTGATIFLLVGLSAISAALFVLAGPWWTLLGWGIIFMMLGFYIIGKVIDG